MLEQDQNTNENLNITQNNKIKILIVDDDKFLLDMYVIKFREQGFDVTSVLSGEDALSHIKAAEDSFSAVLLDLIMPGMDGFELLKNIREQELCHSCRIIVLSNLGEPSDIEKAKQFSINGYIVKASSTPSEVVEKVKKILDS